MQEADCLVIVAAPLRDDVERIRWYGGNGHTCLVLTVGGRLLEPHPTFGPTEYRLLASEVTLNEARAFAATLNFRHFRSLLA